MPDLAVLTAPAVPYRALVIDDEAGISAVLVSQLAMAGWEAVAVTTKREAQAVIDDRTKTLDLVFVDLKLPDGDGMELIPLIRRRRDHPDVVIVTGFQSEDSLLAALRSGVLDYLNKPFSTQDVANVLRAKAVRARESLGVFVDRFERVDKDFAQVHRELHEIREAIKTWDEMLPDAKRGSGQ